MTARGRLRSAAPGRRLFAAALAAALLAGCRTTAPAPGGQAGCESVLRGAFDIGSGSTKVQVARVLVCPRPGDVEVTLQQVCYRANEAVPYSAELKRSADNRLPESIVGEGLATMERLRRDALAAAQARCGSAQVRGWRGIMTEVFRNAANAREVRDRMAQALAADGRPMPIKILSQDEEALYGYYPILHAGVVDPASLAIWDMGGGSTQVTVFAPGAGMAGARVLKTHLGTGTFAAALLARKKELGAGDVLHPLGPALVPAGVDIVRGETEPAAAALGERKPAELLRGRTVLGIGGVLSISVPTIVAHVTGKPAAPLSVLEVSQRLQAGGVQSLRAAGIARRVLKKAMDELLPDDEAKLLEVARACGIAPGFASSLPVGLLLAYGYASPEVLDVGAYTPVQMDATDTLQVLHQYDDERYWAQP